LEPMRGESYSTAAEDLLIFSAATLGISGGCSNHGQHPLDGIYTKSTMEVQLSLAWAALQVRGAKLHSPTSWPSCLFTAPGARGVCGAEPPDRVVSHVSPDPA